MIGESDHAAMGDTWPLLKRKEASSRIKQLSCVDGELFVEEVGKFHKEIASLFGVKHDSGNLLHGADLGKGDQASVGDGSLQSVTGGDNKSGFVGRHEISLNLYFEDGKLKSTDLREDGKMLFFMIAPFRPSAKGGSQ